MFFETQCRIVDKIVPICDIYRFFSFVQLLLIIFYFNVVSKH